MVDVKAVETYRYLRLAIIALVVGLGAAVITEFIHNKNHCLQTSISAYYYTPAHGFFVTALLAIGVCLFVLKGSTPVEDSLLNLAGMFAAVVALVPTPNPGTCISISLGNLSEANGDPTSLEAMVRRAEVSNNVIALFVTGVAALGVLLALAWFKNRRGSAGDWFSAIELVPAVGLLVVAFAYFVIARTDFIKTAHYISAGLMFVCIIAVVGINARASSEGRQLQRRYVAVFVLMLLAVAVILPFKFTDGFAHWLLALEVSLISLFATFWLFQTVDFWSEGTGAPTKSP